jgi:extracellular factor (EF) 3-hydroxypalmitic acid methyl ester biosynthesis protein
MSKPFQGNGNGNGANGLLEQPKKKAAQTLAHAPSSEGGESWVTFQTHDGTKFHAIPARVTRHEAVFELYGALTAPRLSEALDHFQITLQGQTVYSGRAVVRNVVEAGAKIVCAATLNDAQWVDLNLVLALQKGGQIEREFKAFLQDWQKLYKVQPEFKIVMADMETFLYDLRLWLEQVELQIRASPSAAQLEQKIAGQLTEPIIHALDAFIERFESIAASLDDDLQPAHRAYLRSQLHPFLLCSPFAHRAYEKPLGYAGDYQLVEMMTRSPYEGGTLFAKIINAWLLGQLPTQGHRNRLKYLTERMELETYRVARRGGTARIFNFACGPALEMQNFLHSTFSEKAELTLADFNDETLEYTRRAFERIKSSLRLQTPVHFQKKSVVQLLKESHQSVAVEKPQYDFVYCAGLFDYLPDITCRQLMSIFYACLAPGGLLVTTNVNDALNASRPFRYSMEYILDWNLLYRNRVQMISLVPDGIADDDITVATEDTGTNMFLEVRRPDHA